MSKYSRDLQLLLLRQNDYDLMVKYHELLCLRAELARLLSRSNGLPSEHGVTRQNRSAAGSVKRDEGRVSRPSILLLLEPERPQT